MQLVYVIPVNGQDASCDSSCLHVILMNCIFATLIKCFMILKVLTFLIQTCLNMNKLFFHLPRTQWQFLLGSSYRRGIFFLATKYFDKAYFP